MLVTIAAPTAPGHGQLRHDPPDDDPARDEEQDRPDEDDRGRAGAARRSARRRRSRRTVGDDGHGRDASAGAASRRSTSGSRLGGRRRRRQGVPQRDDDSDHDRPDDPARRPRRVLRGGRAARRPGAARPAGGRRRRRRRGRARRRRRRRATRRASSASTRRCRCARPYRRCPDAVFLPVDGRRYQAASRDVMAILRRFTPLVEPISIDEAFLDVTGLAALFGDGPAIAGRIKDEVRAEVGLTASVGVATTKLVAKIASDLRKPDGLVVVPPGEEAAFLAPLADRAAVGRRREDRRRPCASTGSGRSATSPRCPPTSSIRRFGKHGASLVDRARGHRRRTRSTTATRRSRSATSTRSTSTRAIREVIERTLLAMAEGVAGRLRVGRRPGRDGRGQDPRQRRSGRSPASGRCPSRPT